MTFPLFAAACGCIEFLQPSRPAPRAHWTVLVRKYEFDFVMTSEREWACCAELSGVSIGQLQRHEGIDAVHVSTGAGVGARLHYHGHLDWPGIGIANVVMCQFGAQDYCAAVIAAGAYRRPLGPAAITAQ